ncbi:unnamed protein product, partial [Choristocarpus tenellus]
CIIANWAQIAGDRVQNYAIPYEHGAADPIFSPRMGMALTTNNISTDNINDWGYLYILGGDSYVRGIDEETQSDDGEYLNDVWVSEGSAWDMFKQGLKPMAKSEMYWREVNPGHIPPTDVTYEDWIACQGLQYHLDDSSVCQDKTEPPGSYLTDNMWSPRRNHRSVSIDDHIFVLGGRAREHADIQRVRTVGGLLSPRVAQDNFQSSWREPSVLKNDVWASKDAGATWWQVTPGCHAPLEA